MRKGGGKQKGAAFEREICVSLSKWVSNDAREDLYWRSAMSGGRASIASKSGKGLHAQVGDISCIDSMGQPLVDKFIIETKFYKNLGLHLFPFGSGEFLIFWATLCKQAKEFKKFPLLIAKQNRIETLLATNDIGAHFLRATAPRLIIPSVDMCLFTLADILSSKFSETRIVGYDYQKALARYNQQRYAAARREIDWLFTFDSWVSTWERDLGKNWLCVRGNKKGSYVMARNGDIGPYAPWNVRCILHEENDAERSQNKTAARGVSVSTNKLSEKDVISIYYDARTYREIALQYGVDTSNVYSIKHKNSWKHILNDLDKK